MSWRLTCSKFLDSYKPLNICSHTECLENRKIAFYIDIISYNNYVLIPRLQNNYYSMNSLYYILGLINLLNKYVTNIDIFVISDE